MENMDNISFDDGAVAVVVEPASFKQVKYLRYLLETHDDSAITPPLPQAWLDMVYDMKRRFAVKTDQQITDLGAYKKPDLIKLIGALKVCPKRPAEPKPDSNAAAVKRDRETYGEPPTEDGIYRNEAGTVFKVYWSLNANSRLLAKKLVPSGDKFEWAYAGMAHRFVRASDKLQLTLAEAREFGAMYGRCSQCGRTLNNELSIYLGIGPVCGERDFGGEFKFMLKQAKRYVESGEVDPTPLELANFEKQSHEDHAAEALRAIMAGEITIEDLMKGKV